MAGVPMGLDFGAVMAIGAAQDVDLELLADTLPEYETAILTGLADQADES
jgi:hypothetical protein